MTTSDFLAGQCMLHPSLLKESSIQNSHPVTLDGDLNRDSENQTPMESSFPEDVLSSDLIRSTVLASRG